MNNTRRKTLYAVISTIEEQLSVLEAATGDEQDYLDNMPENLQESQRYEDAEENVGDLESAAESLNEAIESITTAIDR